MDMRGFILPNVVSSSIFTKKCAPLIQTGHTFYSASLRVWTNNPEEGGQPLRCQLAGLIGTSHHG